MHHHAAVHEPWPRDSKAGAAGLLALAAAPTFAVMALVTSGPPDMLCTPVATAWSGMAAMYLLMSLFHAGPWLKRLAIAREPTATSQGAIR